MRVDSLDKVISWKKKHYDLLFIGDDWKGNERWKQTEKDGGIWGKGNLLAAHGGDEFDVAEGEVEEY